MALANEPPDASVRPGPSRLTETLRQDLHNMDFQDSTAHIFPTPRGPSDKNAGTDSRNQADGAWQTVLTLRQKKALAKEKAKSVDFSRTSNHQQASTAEATGKSKHRPAYRRLAPLAQRRLEDSGATTSGASGQEPD
ncbi:hypothetical protein MTO96_029264 [Rhipicephalus appendiculatus]